MYNYDRMNRKIINLHVNRGFQVLSDKIKTKTSHIVLLTSAFLLLVFATYFNFIEINGFRQLNLVDFEIGRVADRDVVARGELSYIDENATKIRRDARQRLVQAVFRYDRELSADMLSQYIGFAEYLENTMKNTAGIEQFVLQVQQAYPGILDKKIIQTLFTAPDRIGILAVSRNMFKQIVSEGIAGFPDEGMEKFNQSDVELVHWKNDRQERVEFPKDSLLKMDDLRMYTSNALTLMKKNPALTDMILALIKPFLKENIVFQTDESEAKLETAVRQVLPVLVKIDKGQKIIKRGFIITAENYSQLEGLASSGMYIDVRQFIGTVLFLFLILISCVYIFSSSIMSVHLKFRNIAMLVFSFSLLYGLVLILSRVQIFALSADLAVVVPAALITMLITVLIDHRVAILMSFIFSVGMLCASSFSFAPALFVLFSGISGISVMRITGKRIDLVKAACLLALMNPAIIGILYIIMPGSSRDIVFTLLVASFNGFMSGILVLGFLPILESLLNTSTSFRLMEFSDLNSPIMKKMLLSISGTYNHSIMVATLAESACREIGADSLLARVGAYYHDIGKLDQSEYYVENQIDYNKHMDINPRLSATIIRSHVKQGIERARQMRLPREVIDIISEHHGNSIIHYFYNEAKKLNDSVNPEDFMYPGNPPRSKESAVVMLADVVEAACRTLDKPSVPRLEKFIHELVQKKIETNQLDNSDLTFSEIGIIKKTFLNILAGYYHSRIEYPHQKDPDSLDMGAKNPLVKGRKHE